MLTIYLVHTTLKQQSDSIKYIVHRDFLRLSKYHAIILAPENHMLEQTNHTKAVTSVIEQSKS